MAGHARETAAAPQSAPARRDAASTADGIAARHVGGGGGGGGGRRGRRRRGRGGGRALAADARVGRDGGDDADDDADDDAREIAARDDIDIRPWSRAPAAARAGGLDERARRG
jgi:hypothetical protein